MGKRKDAAAWRVLLAALRRTGNVRAAAAEAGMDVGTVYDRRIREPRFAARFAAARAKGKATAAARKARLKRAGELVLRDGVAGPQYVRAAPGRWSQAVEDAFFAALDRSACVRWSAAAAGISTTALYYRRRKYPDFAAQWDAILERAKARIPDLLAAATIASLDPEIESADLPRINVDQAIAIARLKCGERRGGGRNRHALPEPPIEEVRASIMRKLDAIEAHEKKKAEKTGEADGHEDGNGDGHE